jgi:subtilisin-like proprotein convertase family protein
MAALCEPAAICAGTTFGGDFGICVPAWMHQSFAKGDSSAIPDGDAGGLWSGINVTGLATVAMDAVLWLEIDHADPSQLTVSLLPPPSYDGSYNYEGVLFDQQPVAGSTLALHLPTFFYPGDEAVNGLWQLKVVDHATGATGTLVHWGLEFTSRWD